MGRCCGGLVARRLPPGLLLWLAWLVSQLASWLELARSVTELEHRLSSQQNSNEPSRATNERVRASYRATSFLSSPSPTSLSHGPTRREERGHVFSPMIVGPARRQLGFRSKCWTTMVCVRCLLIFPGRYGIRWYGSIYVLTC